MQTFQSSPEQDPRTKQKHSETFLEEEKKHRAGTSMASTCFLPKPIAQPFLKTSPLSHSHSHPSSEFSIQPSKAQRQTTRLNLKKKNEWLDPFDDGPDPDMEYGSLYADGKQDEDPRPLDNPDNPYGFLKFPAGYSVEIASLALKIRGDVRVCCCVVAGGVYENLLFFPIIQLLKDRYPGVMIDVITSERGKQTYELNKNVRWANVWDIDNDFPVPAEYMDMLGLIRGRFYDMILSTKIAGLGHATFLFLSTARDRVSYVYPNVNAAGAGLLLSETFTPDTLNLSEKGYNMYEEMLGWLGKPFRSVPKTPVPPLRVSISKKVREAVEAKYKAAGVETGKYIVIHGIESDSAASMQSRGDTDSLLSIEQWAKIANSISELKPLIVIPHERERENVEEEMIDPSIVFITTPGQLAALINDSAGVIATNTAAIQLANARGKPSIALFSSEEKGRQFVPNAEDKQCTIIWSKTGVLKDIDVGAVATEVKKAFERPLALV
ncbi:Photosynthetic NDH subunit of subcomplex B 1, chloroplastic [Linum perenne]